MRKYAKDILYGMMMVVAMMSLCVTKTDAMVSSVEVIKRVLATVAIIEDNDDQVLFVQIDNIRRDVTDSQTYTLDSGSEYGIIVVGDDERIQDIDVKVYDQDGDLVGKDSDNENIAMVSVAPRRRQKYEITVSAYEMSSNDGFYGIIIYRND